MAVKFEQNIPIYLQVAQMIKESVIRGDLAEGEPIPSVRKFSVDQGLNPQTVLNASQILVSDDILEKRRGLGLFVTEGARARLLAQEIEHYKMRQVPALISRGKLLGVAQSELVKLVKDNYQE
ncbi:GntR family transcriptional regulator [Candidatus Neomarinimicrobiota bacterium]